MIFHLYSTFPLPSYDKATSDRPSLAPLLLAYTGMRLHLRPDQDTSSWVIEDASLSFGGMAPTTILAKASSLFLQGKTFSEETIRQAIALLVDEVKLPDNVPGGQSQYRVTLAGSFLRRAYVKMCVELKSAVEASQDQVMCMEWSFSSVPIPSHICPPSLHRRCRQPLQWTRVSYPLPMVS